MINLLKIKGSPRPESNSFFILDKIAKGISNSVSDIKIKTIEVNKLKISPCQSCFECNKNGHCIINDDMQDLYEEFDKADIILLSTPVFFNGISAQLKAMIDRCQAIWASKYEANNPIINREKSRLGYLIVTGGMTPYKDQFIAARKVASMFFRVTNTEQIGDLTVSNIDKKPVFNREELATKAVEIGKDLVQKI